MLWKLALDSAIVATDDTAIRCVEPSGPFVQAPSPVAAHHRRPSAGWLATPTRGTPSIERAMSVVHIGMPLR
jgi:hypothetical protein